MRGPDDTVLTKQGREIAAAVAVLAGLACLSLWWSGTPLIQAIDATVSFVGWLIFLIALIRILWLPVQYLRHQAALDARIRELEEQDVKRSSENTTERISAMVVRTDRRLPEDYPWWRW